MKVKHLPLILAVNCNEQVVNAWEREILNNTCLGVLVATSLHQAASYLRDHSLKIGALIVEVQFSTPGSQAPDLGLNDGADLALYASEERTSSPCWLVSSMLSPAEFEHKVAGLRGRAAGWFNKLNHTLWGRIEAELLKMILLQDSACRRRVEESGFDVESMLITRVARPDHVRKLVDLLKLPRITYYSKQSVNSAPVEFKLTQMAGAWLARVEKFGDFADGRDMDAVDALAKSTEALVSMGRQAGDPDAPAGVGRKKTARKSATASSARRRSMSLDAALHPAAPQHLT